MEAINIGLSKFCCCSVSAGFVFQCCHIQYNLLCMSSRWVGTVVLSLACNLCTQIRPSTDPTRPRWSEALHWLLHSLAAHTDVPAVLPRGACLWRRAVCSVCIGCQLWDQRCSGARTFSAAQNGPCRIYRQCCQNKSMKGMDGDTRHTTFPMEVMVYVYQYRLYILCMIDIK